MGGNNRSIETWYFAYALMGLTVAGLVPVLLPLLVSHGGNAEQVGLVMAAISLGGLTSPLWGSLADRLRLHRLLLGGGMLVAAAALAGLAFVSQPGLWLLLAGVQGLGAASAATVANLFVVEAHPKEEWDQRIGRLQTFYGIGQVSGLLLAGLLTQMDMRVGLLCAAVLSAASAILGWLTTRTPPAQPGLEPVLLHPARIAETAFHSPQRLFHAPDLKGLKNLRTELTSPFGLFLLTWFLAFAGPAAFFSQYPILLQKVFAVGPSVSSIAFAVIASLGLGLYTPAGKWSERRGPGWTLRTSLWMRLAAFAALFSLGFSPSLAAKLGFLALGIFGLVVWAWSLMSVSGTALAARLSQMGEGSGLGMFNAVTAVAGVAGALLGGWAAGVWGYSAIILLALLGVISGLALSFLFNQPAT